MYIAGHAVGGPCDSSVQKTPIVSPFGGRVVGATAEGGWSHMDAALDAAREAFPAWAATPRHARARLLRQAASLAREEVARLVEAAVLEIAKPRSLAAAEVARLAVTFDLAADLLSAPTGEHPPADVEPRGEGGFAVVERFPRGVVLAITPYNWPYNLAAHKLAPALAAGNTVVLKPSPLAALCSSLLVRLLHSAGLPDGVANLVHCPPDVAERAARDPRTALVSFTGSEAVGFHIRSVVPDKPVVLELGGDASAVVLPDCDLAHAARRVALSAYAYAGQVCISTQHALVHEAVYDEFRELLAAATRETPVGDPAEPGTVCGPLISEAAAERAVSWVAEACDGGARVVAGGGREGNLLSPTLLEGVPQGSKLATEEAFCPVLDLRPVSGLDEAVEVANRSRFGLNAGLFTSDLRAALAAFRALQVGTLVVGDAPSLRLDHLPYGGTKRSGLGREGVREAYFEMTEPRVLLVAPG